MTSVASPAARAVAATWAKSAALPTQHDLRLPVSEPVGEVAAALGGQRCGDGGVRDLDGYLSPPHVKIRADHHGKLRCHPGNSNALAAGRTGR